MHHRMQYSVHLLTDWTLLSGSSQEKKCITAAGAPWKSLCEEPMKPLALKCHPIQGHRYQAYTCTICIYTIHQNIVCCFLTPLSAWHILQKQHSDGFALKSHWILKLFRVSRSEEHCNSLCPVSAADIHSISFAPRPQLGRPRPGVKWSWPHASSPFGKNLVWQTTTRLCQSYHPSAVLQLDLCIHFMSTSLMFNLLL